MRERTIKVHQLRVGDRFRWEPKPWYGESVLRKPVNLKPRKYTGFTIPADLVCIKADAAVVNPPAINYVRADATVVLLEKAK